MADLIRGSSSLSRLVSALVRLLSNPLKSLTSSERQPHASRAVEGERSAGISPESTALRRVIYRSLSCIDSNAVAQLSLDAQTRNSQSGITGVLFVFESRFYQVLEGERDNISRLLALIRQDTRHTDMTVLHDAPALARHFPYWTMGTPARFPDMLQPVARLLDSQLLEDTAVALEALRLCVEYQSTDNRRIHSLEQAGANMFSTTVLQSHGAVNPHVLRAQNLFLSALLKQAESARDAFFSSVSHEVRTPLAGVLGASTLLVHPKNNAQARERHFSSLSFSAHKLQTVLDGIIEVSRLKSGDVKLNLSPFQLTDLCGQIEQTVETALKLRNNRIVFEIDASTDTKCIADRGRLRQAIVSLVDHSMQSTENGTITVSLNRCSVWDKWSWWQCSVQDTRLDISPERKRSFFSAFSQSRKPDRAGYETGPGLDLALVKLTAETMGGQAGISSEPGQGSFVWFTFMAEAA